MPLDLAPALALPMALALLFAAFVRGYSGFGFSAIFIAFAALVTDPRPLIPAVFLCEIVMTAVQARGLRGHIDWRSALLLLAGAALAVPVSVAILVRIGEDSARLAVSALIGALSLVLLSGWQLRRRVGTPGLIGTGLASGLANGAGVGGLPVAALLAAQPIPPSVFRATMIVYLTGLDLLTVPVMAANGLVTRDTFLAAALALPLLTLGILLGSRRFGAASPQEFRRMAIVLLLVLSGLGLLRAAVV